MKVLIVAPHPDDEVLGLGGTMHRLAAEGHELVVAIATKGWAPLFDDEQVARVREEALAANRSLGVHDVRFCDLPVTKLHALPRTDLNRTFADLVDDVRPEWVFVPFPGDRHEDHRQVFEACMVALRPLPDRTFLRRVLSYETVSETHWSVSGIEPAFDPQHYVDISEHLEAKCDAMRLYASQIRPKPDARSIEAVTALAVWRGSVVGMHAAEAFMVVRSLHDG